MLQLPASLLSLLTSSAALRRPLPQAMRGVDTIAAITLVTDISTPENRGRMLGLYQGIPLTKPGSRPL